MRTRVIRSAISDFWLVEMKNKDCDIWHLDSIYHFKFFAKRRAKSLSRLDKLGLLEFEDGQEIKS